MLFLVSCTTKMNGLFNTTSFWIAASAENKEISIPVAADPSVPSFVTFIKTLIVVLNWYAHLHNCSMPNAADRQAGHLRDATKLCSVAENLEDKCSEDLS